MKKNTLKNGLVVAMFVLAGTVYSQTTTPVNNLIRLVSLNTVAGGTSSVAGPPISLITEDDSAITIDAAGVVTIGSDYTPTASLPTSGTNFIKDVSSLGLYVTGGSTQYEMLSIFNNSLTPQNWRVTNIEFKLIDSSSKKG